MLPAVESLLVFSRPHRFHNDGLLRNAFCSILGVICDPQTRACGIHSISPGFRPWMVAAAEKQPVSFDHQPNDGRETLLNFISDLLHVHAMLAGTRSFWA